MFSADVAVIEPFGFLRRIGENAFAFIRKRKIDRRRDLFPNRGSAFNFLTNAFNRRMISQETVGQVLIFADQSQQQMLSFDGRTSKLASFVASEEDDPPCSLSISFEHSRLILSCSRNRCGLYL